MKSLSCARLLATPWTAAYRATSEQNKCWRGCGETETFAHCWLECKRCEFYGKQWKQFHALLLAEFQETLFLSFRGFKKYILVIAPLVERPQKWNMELPRGPASPLPGVPAPDGSEVSRRSSHAWIHSSVLNIGERWTQSGVSGFHSGVCPWMEYDS